MNSLIKFLPYVMGDALTAPTVRRLYSTLFWETDID